MPEVANLDLKKTCISTIYRLTKPVLNYVAECHFGQIGMNSDIDLQLYPLTHVQAKFRTGSEHTVV